MRRRLGRADLLPLGVALAFAGLAAWSPLRDLDWGWHLATFERWLAEGRLPRDDRFSYASQGPYEPVHVVFQLLVGLLVRAWGLTGLVVYKALLNGAIGGALFLGLRRAGAGPWPALALVLLTLTGGLFRLMERPHLFTTLGVVLLVDALLAARAGRLRHPARLVPILAVWANAHPGVVFGALLTAGFVGAEALWLVVRRVTPRGPEAMPPDQLGRLALWAGLGLLATFANPLGPGLYPYLVAHRDMQSALDVGELRGLFAHPERGVAAHLTLAVLFLGGALVALRRPRRLVPTLALATLAFAVLGVVVAREGPLALVLLAYLLAPVVGRGRGGRWGVVLLVLALLPPAAALAERAARGRCGAGLAPGVYPVAAAEWIRAHRPAGPLYNSNDLGGYLVWRLAQEPEGWQVYSDGRMPMFGEALRLARDFRAVEARYAPQVLVLTWGPRLGVAPREELTPGFTDRYALVHAGPGAKVYLRRGGANQALVERFGYAELRYVGWFWPGRVERLGGAWVRPLPPPADPAAFARDVARARAESPGLPHLPPPAPRGP